VLGEGLVALMVDDLERSIRFYRDDLGLHLTGRWEDDAAELAGPGLRLRLHHRRREIPDRGSGTAAVGFRVTDLADASERLRQRGVRVGRPIRSDGRVMVLFDDPDQNHLYLYELELHPVDRAEPPRTGG
jgi:catechol 2,3-dioxygenase-like lactoylglutathione lyase family enzyme